MDINTRYLHPEKLTSEWKRCTLKFFFIDELVHNVQSDEKTVTSLFNGIQRRLKTTVLVYDSKVKILNYSSPIICLECV